MAFIGEFLARCAVFVPTITIVGAVSWLLLAHFGKLRLDQGFSATDLRTWPLPYLLADAIVFAVAFAAVSAWVGDGPTAAAWGGAVASVIAMGLVPALLARLKG